MTDNFSSRRRYNHHSIVYESELPSDNDDTVGECRRLGLSLYRMTLTVRLDHWVLPIYQSYQHSLSTWDWPPPADLNFLSTGQPHMCQTPYLGLPSQPRSVWCAGTYQNSFTLGFCGINDSKGGRALVSIMDVVRTTFSSSPPFSANLSLELLFPPRHHIGLLISLKSWCSASRRSNAWLHPHFHLIYIWTAIANSAAFSRKPVVRMCRSNRLGCYCNSAFSSLISADQPV